MAANERTMSDAEFINQIIDDASEGTEYVCRNLSSRSLVTPLDPAHAEPKTEMLRNTRYT